MDRLQKSELQALRQDVQRLSIEVDALRMLPTLPQKTKLTFWEKILGGKLIYDGPKICGHCHYWKEAAWSSVAGNCSLLWATIDKKDGRDSCNRFIPKRKYMRRVK